MHESSYLAVLPKCGTFHARPSVFSTKKGGRYGKVDRKSRNKLSCGETFGFVALSKRNFFLTNGTCSCMVNPTEKEQIR
jgi:hypothetical protein